MPKLGACLQDICQCRRRDSNPHGALAPPDFESCQDILRGPSWILKATFCRRF